MVDVQQLSGLSEQQLRELASSLIAQIARKDQDILYRQAKIDQLTHELAVLKRWKFGKSREHLDPAQASLLDEAIDGDIAAIEVELEQLAPAATATASTAPRTQPKRMPLPANLPRREVGHEPDSTTCQTPGCGCEMKRIGEDVAERLDYTPGVFTVERHVRGKWACLHCQTLTQAPVPAQVIDKGIPTSGLLGSLQNSEKIVRLAFSRLRSDRDLLWATDLFRHKTQFSAKFISSSPAQLYGKRSFARKLSSLCVKNSVDMRSYMPAA